MRIIKSLALLTLWMGLILSINVAYADNSDGTHLEKILASLRQRYNNIDSMQKVLRGEEELVGSVIEKDIFPSMILFRNLIDLEDLEHQMKSLHDRSAVKVLIRDYVEKLKVSCTESTELINQKMTLLNNPGLLSEAEHARDDLAQGCDLVQRWK